MIRSVLKKFPTLKQIMPVYALIVAVIYYWALLHFFWRIPSWILYSSVGDILSNLAYLLVVNLIESLMVLLVPIVLSLALPQKWFNDRFVTKGLLLVSFGLAYLIYFDKQIQANAPFPYELIKWTPIVALLMLALVFVLDRIEILGKFLTELADRLTIFVYILVPLSLLSALVVLIRNLV